VELLKAKILDFILPALWPPNNPDLESSGLHNVVGDARNVYQHRIKDVGASAPSGVHGYGTNFIGAGVLSNYVTLRL